MNDFGDQKVDQTIDWLLGNIDDLNFDLLPDSGCYLSLDDIEQFLVNDDEFPSDSLLKDSSSSSPESVEVVQKEEDLQIKSNIVVDDNVEEDDSDDSATKKRKRRLRNKDAALRSRERKKLYVRDLEMKSRYYEAECKRLGILLQSCLAENQALRFSMHNTKAFDASMAKQESAVLLELLLLGSLLGPMGIICMLLLSSQLLPTLGNAANEEWGRAAPRKVGSDVCRVSLPESFLMSKRCKASRSRFRDEAMSGKLLETCTC